MMWRNYWWIILLAILAVPLMSVAVFAYWIRKHPNGDLETKVKCWDVFIRLISALTVIITGAMLFGRYIDQQEDLQKQEQEQAKQQISLRKAEFLRQRLQFDAERHQRKRLRFDEAKGIAATLANTAPPDKVAAARFDEMYFASLIGVENASGPVERAMVRFRRKLRSLEGAPTESFEQLSLELSQACEKELEESEASLMRQHADISELLTVVRAQ